MSTSSPSLSHFSISNLMYPQRPGLPTCAYFMKTGKCHYSSRCRFHHPQRDKRLLASLSRRDCFDFIQSGTCTYGADCKYNHPQLPIYDSAPEIQSQTQSPPHQSHSSIHLHPTPAKPLPVPLHTDCFRHENLPSYEHTFSSSPVSNNTHHRNHQRENLPSHEHTFSSSPISNNTRRLHHQSVPTFSRSAGTCSSICWSASMQGEEDPIDIDLNMDSTALLRQGLRPRQWNPNFSPTSPAAVPVTPRSTVAGAPKGTSGFDPLAYDTQIFDTRNIWAISPSPASLTR